MNRISVIGKNIYSKIKTIKNLSFISEHKITPLGRWSMDYQNIDKKVDYANEDHCGICDEYRLKRINELNKLNK